MKNSRGSTGQKRPVVSGVKQLRLTKKENQTEFWQRFGVTQSRGSRFEQGGEIPMSVVVLIELYLQHKISDSDLQNVLRNIARNGRGHYANDKWDAATRVTGGGVDDAQIRRSVAIDGDLHHRQST